MEACVKKDLAKKNKADPAPLEEEKIILLFLADRALAYRIEKVKAEKAEKGKAKEKKRAVEESAREKAGEELEEEAEKKEARERLPEWYAASR